MSPLRATVKQSQILIFQYSPDHYDRKTSNFSVSVLSDFISDRYTVFSESVSIERLSEHSLYLLIIFKYTWRFQHRVISSFKPHDQPSSTVSSRFTLAHASPYPPIITILFSSLLLD